MFVNCAKIEGTSADLAINLRDLTAIAGVVGSLSQEIAATRFNSCLIWGVPKWLTTTASILSGVLTYK